MSRLPPNQALASSGKWPVVGERAPRRSDAPWTVEVCGQVAHPQAFDLDALRSLGWVERDIDVHCVTRWSKLAMRFGGVPLNALLDVVAPTSDARFVSFGARSTRDHTTSLPLAEVRALDALVAFTHDGAPLPEIHGGPVRMVVPGKYFYKSVKWLERVELRVDDVLGYWEAEAGYHNEANPDREQRYVASGLSRREAQALVHGRDIAGQVVLSLAVPNLDLSGLDARRAQLRNADFRAAVLVDARFDQANLSNACFRGADLRGASFVGSDVEGASFEGADLRGARFSGASVFGATFCPEPGQSGSSARLQAGDTLDPDQLDALNDVQRAFWLAPNQALRAQTWG